MPLKARACSKGQDGRGAVLDCAQTHTHTDTHIPWRSVLVDPLAIKVEPAGKGRHGSLFVHWEWLQGSPGWERGTSQWPYEAQHSKSDKSNPPSLAFLLPEIFILHSCKAN